MTTVNAHITPSTGRHSDSRCGAWRLAAALPAMLGSLLTLLVLFSWLGQWEGMVLLAWLALGAAAFTSPGEKIAVRLGCGFRRPSGLQLTVLAPLWSQALAHAQLHPDQVDLYVQRSREQNAFAAGGYSVAVTSGILAGLETRRLTEAQAVAILAHEIGHVRTRGTRFALAAMWLAAPWRFLSRLLLASTMTFARRQSSRLLALVVVVAISVAIVQSVQQHHWMTAVVLGGVATASVLCPLVDAAASRRSEFAADRYAAGLGLGQHLALALEAVHGGGGRRSSWMSRLVSRHPDVASRFDRLVTTVD